MAALPLLAVLLVLVLPHAHGDAVLQHSYDEASFHVAGHISMPADTSVCELGFGTSVSLRACLHERC